MEVSCKDPRLRHGILTSCGQCLPCRVKYRRLWTHRCLLEQRMHSDSSFLTLTYSDEKMEEH